MIELPAMLPALPEIMLATVGMVLLMAGAFGGEGTTRWITWVTIVSIAVAALLVLYADHGRELAFGGLFVTDPFAVFMKELVLIGSGLTLILSLDFNERERIGRFEYPILILYATVGMMMMVSANDLISLYIGLELQSLCLYVVAAFRRDTVRSSEAGLKYFVLGALSSAMLLYGATMIYGFSGTTRFDALAGMFAETGGHVSIGVIIGIVFVAAGLAFKLAAVPFHMWTPDVYEGAPTPVTAFFAAAPKMAAIALFIRVMIEPLGNLFDQWQQIVVFISIGSMVLGAFAGIWQTNIKRLMAYSSIGHVGYALIGLAAGTEDGVRGVLVYMAIYLPMVVGTFACILCMRQKGRTVEGIEDLAGLSRTSPAVALALAIFMFSMAGIPPLAGFFGKLYIFQAAIASGLVTLAVIGVLASVVAAFYYLRIIKLMYFDEATEAFDRPIGREVAVVLAGTGVFILFFVVHPSALVDGAAVAAASLFGG